MKKHAPKPQSADKQVFLLYTQFRWLPCWNAAAPGSAPAPAAISPQTTGQDSPKTQPFVQPTAAPVPATALPASADQLRSPHQDPSHQPHQPQRSRPATLHAAIDLLSGEVTGEVSYERQGDGTANFTAFLDRLDAGYPQDLEIRLAVNKRLVRPSRALLDYLSARPGRIRLTFEPAQGAWLNLVEGFFQRLAAQSLTRLQATCESELGALVEKQLDDFNQEALECSRAWDKDDIACAFSGAIKR
ncbi:MAG: hypothetical protein IJ228_03720 [Succinivibrio sp.]|nr:hypothetical protein [Succinivibrio sp.]